ncbi:MAG TPA: outer membrane protein assembly factor BamD [Puia sp.]|jgi:outer membrane protein assembly factor BamD|nr:outer membrane protein assembly factor BamD [Puia sp.]
MRLLTISFLAVFLFTSCSRFSKVMKSNDYDYKLRIADKYYTDKDYNHAQQLFEELFRVFKGSEHFEDIYYKFAYCAYYLKDYPNAENLFKGFVEVFPNSNKAEEMDYMRAYTFYQQSPKVELDQTNTTKAIGFMQAFINTHPGSDKVKEATDIIAKCRTKLELKDFESAQLYYDLGYFRAAGVALNSLMNSYPDSEKSDQYKYLIIKSDYSYANLSIFEKQEDRYVVVVTQCNEFMDRFPDSKLKASVQDYLTNAENNLKTLKNEQVKKAS